MDSQFWKNTWNEGKAGFHQENYHEKLLEYFPQLNPTEGQRVLVPLCGKSKDLLWLQKQKLNVHGVELHDPAVEAFFSENKLFPVEKSQDQAFVHYRHTDITISCGDFFKLNEIHSYDFIYDRAALVALPPLMRKTYAQVIKRSLKRGGKCLLIAYDYDQSKMEGPPFSVEEKEIRALYEATFDVKLLESKAPTNEGPRLSAVAGLKQTIYLLEKR